MPPGRIPELIGASRRLVDDPRIAELYPEYLFTLHCVIRASVPLMEAAREQARKLAKEDPVCEILAPYLDATHGYQVVWPICGLPILAVIPLVRGLIRVEPVGARGPEPVVP